MKLIGGWTVRGLVLLAAVTGCGPKPPPEGPQPSAGVSICDAYQAAISRDADERVQGDKYDSTVPIAQHLATSFPDGRASWLMKEADYQKYVVSPGAKKWGRCNKSGDTCYVFAAPAGALGEKVKQSMTGDRHDPVKLGEALGLPAERFEGPLRLMTLDFGKARTCARLPVCTDPGAYECKSAEDKECFKFGGFTAGGAPEIMLINAPVAETQIDAIP
ncbi:MAG TPA: hypothetical protein VNO30_19065 [Kofleriaceae bacterium]|nr:hypothetical protein [Kofleriaceae bacterium]